MQQYKWSLSVILFSFSILIISCESNSKKVAKIHERLISGEFDAYENLLKVDCDSLSMDTLNQFVYQDSLFTGVCHSFYPSSSKIMEIKQIFRGKLHGNKLNLSENGDTISRYIYNNGRIINKFEPQKINACKCNELETYTSQEGKSIYFYQDQPYTGFCVDHHESDTSKIKQSKQFLNGFETGISYKYNLAGEKIDSLVIQ